MSNTAEQNETAQDKDPAPEQSQAAHAPADANEATAQPVATPSPETKAEPKLDPKRAAERVRRATSLSAVLGLMLASPRHRHMFIVDMEWLVLPPLALNQYRLIQNDGRPVAFASWALISEDVAARLRNGHNKLKPSEWHSGPEPWIIDLICPPQAEAGVLKMLGEKVFAEKAANYLAGSDPEMRKPVVGSVGGASKE